MARIRTSAGALAGLSLLAGGSVLGLRVAADRALGAPEFSIDAGMEQWLLASLGFAAVLLAGHLLFAALRVAREWPYALVGIAAYAVSLAIAAGTALFEVASRSDSISLAVMLPVAAGAIIGVMYPLWVGHDDAGDRPGDLAARLRTSPADFAQFDPASQPVVRTPDETYYSGPVQVRTSFGLLLLAMATPFVVLSALLLLGVHASQEIVLRWVDRAGPRDLFETAFVDGPEPIHLLAWLLGLTLLAFLGTLPGLVVHKIAQRMQWRSAGAYAASGFGFCLVAGFVFPPLLVMAPFVAVSLALYRTWAGLEPAMLPEDVVVRDARTLLPGDHPRRSYHRVIDLASAADGRPGA